MVVNSIENFQTDEMSLEGVTIQLESSGSESIELARKTLVGRILWDKPLNKGAVKHMLIKAWGEDAEELRIMDMGVNVFIFYFLDKKKARSIMKKGPWNVMGHLVSLQYWIPEVSVYEINYDLVSFWVQMHGIPLEFMTTSNVSRIAGMIGEVKEVEDPKVEGVLLRSFMRVRVTVNVKKPLVTGFWVPRKDLPKTWVLVKYEKLQDFCYKMWCDQHRSSSQEDGEPSRPDLDKTEGTSGVPQNQESYSLPGKTQRDRFVSGEHVGWAVVADMVNVLNKTNVYPLQQPFPNPTETALSANLDGIHTLPVGGAGSSSKVAQQESAPNLIPPQPMFVDLKQGKVRPGLGPTSLQLLNVATEDIGLKQHMVILDCLRPTNRYDGPILTLVDIDKCRDAWMELELGRRNYKSRGKAPKEDDPTNPYTVEFPPEEEELESGVSIQKEEESQVIEGFNVSLSLKRDRNSDYAETEQGSAPAIIRELKALKRIHKPTMVFLMETRARKERVEMVVPSGVLLSSMAIQFLELEGTCGGGFLTSNLPMMVLGFEKDGLRPHPEPQMQLFRDWIYDAELIEMENKGCKYTWESNPRDGVVTKEKLDRALANWRWRQLFPHANVLALPPVSSDHSPLIIYPRPKDFSGKQFKFEAMWEEHPQCAETVDKGWNSAVNDSGEWGVCLSRVESCKKELISWHKVTFKRADEEIARLKDRLKFLHNSCDLPGGLEERLSIKDRIKELWKQEEIYWGQCSKVKWLNWGDRNSKFFHSSTIQRRSRNRLSRLRDANGEWVEGHQNISKLVLEHYSGLFTSEDVLSLMIRRAAESGALSERCKEVFNRASPNPVSTSIKIKKLLSECCIPPDTSGAPQSSNASAQQIQSRRPPPPRVGFTWVRRSGNGVAHSLAQYALRGDFFPASSSCWPSDIQSHMANDRQLASSYNLHRDLDFALAVLDVAHEPP
ncbi:Endonuclease/exonuclease/phosphatase superfamily [Sesbania bispinosa]|nr:Endonuclease/exonuclease/phosphatase superfamily [Sesbania bispinosa]